MTLAARCPACATVFRVVQDQLRVSEGWVRCGRCSEVFNAIESLVEVDAELPPRQEPRQRVLDDLARLTASAHPAPTAPPVQAGLNDPVARPMHDAPVGLVAAASPPAVGDAAAPSGVAAGRDGRVGEPSSASTEAPPGAEATPAFLRRAERDARWRRPWVRSLLGATAAVAGFALMAQLLMEYRDVAAARWPALRAPLTAACTVLGCRLHAPRMLDVLTVESSGLVRVEGTTAYRFSVSLRNRSNLDVAPPAIDLSLTDAHGNVVSRRIVRLWELGGPPERVAASTSTSLQATLAVPDQVVSGYTIELFHP